MSTASTPPVVRSSSAREPGSHSLSASRPRYGERVVLGLLWLCAAISVVTTFGIIVVLFTEAVSLFGIPGVSAVEFFTGTVWRPFTDPSSDQFKIGVLPLLNSTLLVTAIALLIAVPLGLATAIYLSEYARPRVRRIVKPFLELLAGVPTVVLGYFALTFMTPVLRAVFGVEVVPIFNAASAGIVVGILVVPTIASISEDSMSAVPRALREGAYGLGSARRHVALKVVFPAALSGIVASIILAFGRAVGETLIVSLSAGNLPPADLPAVDPFQQVQTMTAYITQAVGGESSRGSVTFQSIFAVGALLFVLTFLVNMVALRVVRRFREEY
ncbi:MAG: phosphate ABC transporter permease subunit PstC [Geodermatophilaceae bacterium]|nr:phosphate ABC transporter permease subunit PstC [Geodermatophilaceae bacterium]